MYNGWVASSGMVLIPGPKYLFVEYLITLLVTRLYGRVVNNDELN
jgi:hypothetical protein